MLMNVLGVNEESEITILVNSMILIYYDGGVHRGVHQNVDYNFFALLVNINNHFVRENQHQQRIVKINNQQFKISE